MKISIEGFNQEYALSFKKMIRDEKKEKDIIIKIDVIDLVILRWFVDFYPKMDKFVINGKEYAWLSYSKLVEDLPIIDISKRSFADRLKKMVDFEILDFQLCSDKGNITVYGFGDRYEYLLKSGVENFSGVCSSNNKGVCGLNNKGYAVQTTDIDKTINDKTINDINNINNISKEKENIKEKSTRFQKPTLEELQSYINEKGYHFSAEAFIDYYDSVGWKIGKSPMKSWKSACNTWERKYKESNSYKNPYSSGEISRETAYPNLKKNYL